MRPKIFNLSTRLGRWQLLVISLMILGYSGYYLCRSNLSVLMPDIIQDFSQHGGNPTSIKIQLGWVASLGILGYALGKFLSGNILDFLGGRRGFLGGMSGAIFFTILCTLGGGMPVFTMAWIGNRCAQSMGWLGMLKITSRWFPHSAYGTVVGLLSMSYLFGDALAREFISGLLSYGLNWRTIFVIGAGVLALLLVLNKFLLKESPTDIGEQEPAASSTTVFGNDGNNAKPKNLKSLLKPLFSSKVFWIICLLSLGCTIVRETFNTWIPTYFHEALGFNMVKSASQSAWFPFLGGISVCLFGYLSDYFGAKGRIFIIFSGLLLSGLSQLMLANMNLGVSTFWPVFLVALTAFLLMGPYSFLGGAIALDVGGKQGSATAGGIIDGVGYIGGYLSGGVVAKMSVLYGWYGVFQILGIITISASLISIFLLPSRRVKPIPETQSYPRAQATLLEPELSNQEN
jgi:OPA family glycerol-3-phosphate transporter-like MFS transporter